MNTIMLVEDNPEIGRLMRMLFEMEGCKVVLVDKYDQILPLMHQARPDAVLMDVQINGHETIDIMRQVKRSHQVAHIPVVMTSAADVRRECIEAGAKQFILKPFLPDEVVEEITGLSQQKAPVQQFVDLHNTPPIGFRFS